MVASLVVPREGDYLTDGLRLVYVLFVSDEVVHAEDTVALDDNGEYAVIQIKVTSLDEWKVVKPDAA